MAGIILAGGKSTRMGQDKAQLPFQGATLLSHCVDALRTVFGSVIVVTSETGRYDLPKGVIEAVDHHPGTGPLGGLIDGLGAAGPGSHIVVACDMPFLQTGLLAMLIKESSGVDAVVPMIDGRLQTLCAAYIGSDSVVDKLILQHRAGVRSLADAVQSLKLKLLEEQIVRTVDPDLKSFVNVNSIEDYKRLTNAGKSIE